MHTDFTHRQPWQMPERTGWMFLCRNKTTHKFKSAKYAGGRASVLRCCVGEWGVERVSGATSSTSRSSGISLANTNQNQDRKPDKTNHTKVKGSRDLAATDLVCFPEGTLKEPNGKDLDYMDELMRLIEKDGAPAPIEQRWTSSSSANLLSWVGVIMYLPADDMDARRRVTDAFLAYRDLYKTQLWDRFPIDEFDAVRAMLDPENIMANDHINSCLGRAK